MDEANAEGTCQASVAPEYFDPSPHENSEADQCKHQCQDHTGSLNDLSCQDKHVLDQVQAESKRDEEPVDQKVFVETAVPIDSVKDAASKFGGVLDRKEKRRKHVPDGLDKVQEEVAECRKRSEEAEAKKAGAVQELGGTRRAMEELRLSLEKAETQEAQTQQDTALAEQRLREVQQGIAHGESTAAELEIARDRLATAVADLQAAKEELESLRTAYTALAAERDAALTKARESTAASREVEKAATDLSLELIAMKELLDSSHAAHVEAEAQTAELSSAFEQEKATWQTELKQAEEEVQKLSDELVAARHLEFKVEAASELLVTLRAELFTYVEGTIEEERPPAVGAPATLEGAKKELDDVKASAEKAKDEVKCLRVAAASLRADLEREKAELDTLRRKEALASASISSLEEELAKATSELAAAAERQERADEADTPVQLEEAGRAAEQAKETARLARKEVAKAREEADIAKAATDAMELRLEAVRREVLAAHASEEIATASVHALQAWNPTVRVETEGGNGNVTLLLEEYNELSRRAREAEELASKRMVEAIDRIKEAKEAEVRSLDRLGQAAMQTVERRKALMAALEEAEVAKDGKLAAEQELWWWTAQHRRKVSEASPRAGLAEISTLEDEYYSTGDTSGSNPHIFSPRAYRPRGDSTAAAAAAATTAAAEAEARSRKSFFPRVVMFLARKKAQSLK